MMSFFKNKEQEKEKRKLEKKLNHSLNSSSISSSSSHNNNNNTLTNESFVNNNNSDTSNSSSLTMSNSVHHVSAGAAINNGSTNTNGSNNKLNSSSRSSMDHHHGGGPTLVAASGSATIVSNTQPTKPKKGILKTMSKFGIGPTLSNMSSMSNNSSSSLASSSTATSSSVQQSSSSLSQQQLSALSTIVLSPKLTKTAPKITVTNRAHVNSITYSGGNGRQTTEITATTHHHSHVSHGSLAAAAEFLQHPHSVTFTLPKMNRLPYYLIHLDDLERTQCLMRTVRVPYHLLSRVSLRNETSSLTASLNAKPPILVDVTHNSAELAGFLPGDQLIEINDQVVIYKSLAECAKLIEKLTEEGASRGEHELVFKVKTCLLNAELVVKNDSSSIDAFSRHLIINGEHDSSRAATPAASLKLEAAGFKRKNVNGLLLNGIVGSTSNSLSSNSSSSSSINSLDNNVVSSSSTGGSEYTSANSDLSNVWLTHANGYTQAKIFAKVVQKLEASDTNTQHHQIRYKIRLVDAGGALIEVSEEHLEKANPSPQYDFCEDLSQLRFINESSLIHCLRQRYVTLRHIYTYLTGQSLLCLRPTTTKTDNINSATDIDMYKYVYSDRLVGLFKNCKQEDMPPHVYAYAQSVYRQMLTNRQDQSILMMGHSGSGKTQNTCLLLNYLFKVAAPATPTTPSSLSSTGSIFTEAKLNAMFCLLNGFCCIRSTNSFNSSSNRFLNIFLLEFNHSGQLASLLLQLITFDHTRLVYQPQDETTFLVFEHLLHGAQTNTKRDLMLHDLTPSVVAVDDETFAHKILRSSSSANNKLNTPHEEEINKAAFQRLLDSLKVLNFDEAEIKSVLTILAAIVHLMLAGACRMSTTTATSATASPAPTNGVNTSQRIGQFKSPNDAHKAAQLLGITYNQLNEAVFCSLVAGGNGSGGAASSHGIGGPGGSTSTASSCHNTPRHKYSHLSNSGSRLSPADTNNSLLSNNSGGASSLTPIECLHGFCLGLYQECLSLIVNCINRTFKPAFNQNQAIANSMLLIDPPGFQAHKSSSSSASSNSSVSHNNRQQQHSHSDLMCNYMSERLQLMFYQINFIQPIERYTQEGLDNTDLVEHIPESPSALVNWLDRPPAPPNALLNSHHYLHHHSNYRPPATSTTPSSSNTTAPQDNSCGLLWLMEEQIYSNEIKTARQFHTRLAESDPRQNFMTLNHAQTNGTKKESEEEEVAQTAPLATSFTIYHQFGNQPIEYSLTEWLESYNKEYITQRNALTLLQLSRKETISNTFINSSAMSNAAATLSSSLQSNLTTNSSSSASSANQTSSILLAENAAISSSSSSSLKRQASVRKMLTLSKRKSFVINFKLQIDSVFDSIRKTKPNFMFCLLPDHQRQLLTTSSDDPTHSTITDDVNVAYLRSQLKAYQLLAACRIYRQGYPDFVNFEEFQRRYGMFLSLNDTNSSVSSSVNSDLMKQSCLNIVRSLDLDPTYYKTGTTQIFFKAGVLARLETRRDEKINNFVITLQANCRRHLAQSKYNKKRVQDCAIRCIQKNIRIWFALKQWKWWRLYTHLMPILNVQNSEAMCKQLHDELDEARRKLDRLVNEKNELKIANNQLETKLMNLQTEYVEEHAANAGTIDLLEVESSERMRLEKELSEIRPLYNEAVKKLEQAESEMLELRLYNTKKSIEQELEKDDLDGLSSPVAALSPNHFSASSESTSTVDRSVRRENEQLKKQLRDERDQSRKMNSTERAFFELKLRERDDEYVEMEKQCAVHKRKYQKLSEEAQDMQRMLDETKARNRELEKTQARHDSEMSSLRGKLDAEKELREKCERERDQTRFELFNIKNELEIQQAERKSLDNKVEQLERDLKEYENAIGGTNNSLASHMDPAAQLVKLKAQIRELDTKCKDQEEELDEQSGTIQQLEQAKVRLEMQLEKEKQKWQREIAEKESEMDDLRFHTQKKIKAIEMQLEEESELSNALQREKRDLERKMRDHHLSSNSSAGIMSGQSGMVKSSGSSPHDLTLVASLDYLNKLKRQMLKYKTLALDAQSQLEKWRESMPKQQSTLKSLKSQLEDSEIAKTNALKSKHVLQVEVENLQQQLYEANMHRQNLEEQNIHLNHQLNNLKSELDEQERDTDDIMKKYHSHVQNFSLESHRYIELNNQIDMLTVENRLLKERVHEMEEKITHYETFWVEKSLMSKIESKLRDMENKLEFEQTQKNKFQNQLDRLKAQYDQGMNETESVLTREKKCEDQLKKAQRANKEILEEYGEMKKKLIEQEETKKRVEKQNEMLEKEMEALKMEIRVNQNRLEAFQLAFNSMNESDDDDEDNDDEDDMDLHDDDDVDELIMTYNNNNNHTSGGGENGHTNDMDDDDEDDDEELNYVEEEQLITTTTTKTNGNIDNRNDYSINVK